MSDKIRGFINKLDLESATKLIGDDFSHFRYSKNKMTEHDVGVEITIIEPVYEYKVLFRVDDKFIVTNDYFKSKEDFDNYTNRFYEFVQLIEQSKRVKK